MLRIYATVDDPTLEQIDQDVKEKSISRAQWVSTAVDTYLQLKILDGGASLADMHRELLQLRTETERMWKENQALKRAEEKARSDSEQFRSNFIKLQEQVGQTHLELEKSTLCLGNSAT